MKVLFDHQAFIMQKKGGVSRYFSALLMNLKKYADTECVAPVSLSVNVYINAQRSNAPTGIDVLKSSLRRFKSLLKVYDLFRKNINKSKLARIIEKGDFDVFHPTYYDPYFIKYLKDRPFVITVHDMIHEIYPEFFQSSDETSKNKRLLMMKASRVIAISENTKKDIIKIAGIDPNKIDVIYHANYLGDVLPKPISTPERYILYVGGRKRWKNFNFFLESIAEVLINESIHLMCAGDDFDSEESDLIDSLKIRKFAHSVKANDSELAHLYQNALFLAFPSLYEGFGLPIVEAFSYGCPVALSNTSCFPELAGDSGAYFDPRDKKSIKKTISEMVTNSRLRTRLSKEGRDRSKFYSTKKMCELTQNTYLAAKF